MKKIKGFTLIEMIVTVVLVVVLSTISVPIYQGHLRKAKLSEGYALLAAIRDAQLSYKSEYRNFLHYYQSSAYKSVGGTGYTVNETVLGVNAITNKYFTWFQIGSYYGANGIKGGFCARVRSNDANLVLFYDLNEGSTITTF